MSATDEHTCLHCGQWAEQPASVCVDCFLDGYRVVINKAGERGPSVEAPGTWG